MFKRESKKENVIQKPENQNNPYSSNPLSSSGFNGGIFENINQRIESLIKMGDSHAKRKGIASIVENINSLTLQEVLLLMSSNNEVIRVIAAKAYVDKSPVNTIHSIKKILKSKDEYLRDAGIAALCYINSPELLDILYQATKDSAYIVKFRALTGIADIASEYSNIRAKEILKEFENDENPEISEFVNDELSLLD